MDLYPRDPSGSTDAASDKTTDTHGTQVAGLIAGDVSSAIGTIGAAPDATITASYLRYGDASPPTGSFAKLGALNPSRATLTDSDGGSDTLNLAAA
jgi:hypothetical protein